MVELELWQSGEDLDEAPLRGVIAAKKFWRKDVVKACIELGGLNFERGYHYQVFVCFERQDILRDIIRKVIKLGPGNIKWIKLLLYKQNEQSPCEEVRKVDDFRDFMKRIKKNDEEVKKLATRLVRDYLKIDTKKDVFPEYLQSIRYLIQSPDGKTLICITGYNFQVNEMIRNSREDFKKFGKIVCYCAEEVEKANLIDVEEEEDAYFVMLEV